MVSAVRSVVLAVGVVVWGGGGTLLGQACSRGAIKSGGGGGALVRVYTLAFMLL